jgi:hypothetical protein
MAKLLVQHSQKTWGGCQCYDFVDIFAEKFGKNVGHCD